MPNRMIRDTIRSSESLARLTGDEERHFFRLILLADDFGRFDARSSVIRAGCYPLMLDIITQEDVERWTRRLADQDVGILQLYEVEGRVYGAFRAWEKYQRPRAKESKFPAPPEKPATDDRNSRTSANTCGPMSADENICAHMQTSADTCEHLQAYVAVVVVGDEVEDVGEAGDGDCVSNAVTKAPTVENADKPPDADILAEAITSASASGSPGPQKFKQPDYWRPLTTLEGYAQRDHSKFVATLEATCAAQGVNPGDVVVGFAEYYAGNRFRHGWSDPVAALRRTLTVQIAKLLGTSRSPPHQTPHERRIAAEKAIPIRPIEQV